MMKQSNWLLIIVALTFLLSACSNKSETTSGTNQGKNGSGDGKPKSGGVVQILNPADPDMLDPHKTSSIYAHNILGLVYSKLVTYETGPDVEFSDYNIVPDLAKDWKVSEDGKVYTFHLRENAKWHNVAPVNGRNVNSGDVVATFERIQSIPGHQAYMLDQIDKIETPDDLTVEFHLKQPFAPFLSYMANHFMWILPKEAAEGKINLETAAIGTGPFVLDKWERNVETKFSKNPDYFLEGLPYLDGVNFKTVPDEDTRLAAFRTKQADTTGLLSPQQFANLMKQDPNLQYRETLFPTQTQVYMNMTRKPFDNLKVRQAIAMAIDRKNAVKQIFGNGEVSGPVNPSLGKWALPKEERESLQPYDIEQAKKLLKEAGYPDGFETKVMVTDGYGEATVRMAQWVVEDLRKIGIKAKLEVVEYATYFSQKWPKLDYDIGVGFQSYLQEPDEWLYGQLHSKGAKNWYGIKNPELDKMLEEQRTVMDEDKRLAKILDIQRYALKEVVNPIPLVTHITASPTQPYLKNWNTHASYGMIHMKEVWLDKK
ncbi:ABC transporter substrate-binding protein [Peribacillus glennii]|uniref:ABC transporter substrate-binding protein n=1 Tax=Peribacillus glennii TaxID=2303991 RepID=A0A372LG72_9BACI|nr:ABC transporter substrate-binding protein [Peribacillus glennii]RFU65267.1 ABC transporter substrate-binding protein [Peribacillus glennii]